MAMLLDDLHQSIQIMRSRKQFVPEVMNAPLSYVRAVADELYSDDPCVARSIESTDEVYIAVDGRPLITLHAL